MYLSAKAAAGLLGVSVQTLYSYVSRGLIRSEETGESKRTRRYLAEDVQNLVQRKEGRRSPEKMVSDALRWGSPIMESAITLIAGGRFYYRGMDATVLARRRSVEEVAAFLWTGGFEGHFFDGDFTVPSAVIGVLEAAGPAELYDRLQIALPVLGLDDVAAYDLRPAAVARTGARILRRLTAVVAGTGSRLEIERKSIAGALQNGWTPEIPEAAELFSAALILCADHELNVSAFTARCVASAAASPYGVVEAGLAALRGVRHGGLTDRVERQLAALEGDPREVVASAVRRGEPIPGFGLQVYPEGDPRAALLLQLIDERFPEAPAVRQALAFAAQVKSILGDFPTIDFGLAVLTRSLGLPPGHGQVVFALGRIIGWIAHAIEQYNAGTLVRPRATYVGPVPE